MASFWMASLHPAPSRSDTKNEKDTERYWGTIAAIKESIPNRKYDTLIHLSIAPKLHPVYQVLKRKDSGSIGFFETCLPPGFLPASEMVGKPSWCAVDGDQHPEIKLIKHGLNGPLIAWIYRYKMVKLTLFEGMLPRWFLPRWISFSGLSRGRLATTPK